MSSRVANGQLGATAIVTGNNIVSLLKGYLSDIMPGKSTEMPQKVDLFC